MGYFMILALPSVGQPQTWMQCNDSITSCKERHRERSEAIFYAAKAEIVPRDAGSFHYS